MHARYLCWNFASTVSDKSYAREKLRGFRKFLMSHESFPYEYFEQWQRFQYKTMKAFSAFGWNPVDFETFSRLIFVI